MTHIDDQVFWDRLRDMPHIEAEQLLRDRKRWAINLRIEAEKRDDGILVSKINLLITKINDEIHRVSQLQSVSNLKRAMRAVLTPEQIEAVHTQLATMDPQATR